MTTDEPLNPDDWAEVDTAPYEPIPPGDEVTPREAPPYPERVKCLLCDCCGGEKQAACRYCGGAGWVIPVASDGT